MSENTKIEWCDHTFNPWTGCTKISKGCDGCYAEAWSKRAGDKVGKWGPGAPRVRTTPANWRQPLKWQRQASAFMSQHGRRQRVFCASLADVFDNEVPAEWRADLFRLIAETPDLDWLLLTKRIGNAKAMMDDVARRQPIPVREDGSPVTWEPLPNVWIGATIVNQEEADRDIPKLLAVPARVRFLSMEPLLGQVSLETVYNTDFGEGQPYLHPLIGRVSDGHGDSCSAPSIDWVIVGGESGHGARPMHPDWARSLRDQCAQAGVPFLFKQHGEWAPGSGDFGAGRFKTAAIERTGTTVVPGGLTTTGYPKGAESRDGWAMVHWSGKKASGRLLDGIEHNGFPEAVCQ